MQVTLDIPEEFATRLNSLGDKIPQILELGLRELNTSSQTGFSGIAEVLEFLAQLPTPEEIISLRPSEVLQAEISQLLEKNRSSSSGQTHLKSRFREWKFGIIVFRTFL